MTNAECARCRGKLHIRIGQGTWARCPDCARSVLRQYIKPGLRGLDAALPPEVEGWPVLPLSDLTVQHSNPVLFRRWAWRSLLVYETQSLVYDWIEGYRLVETFFQQDTQYTSVRELADLPLLIFDFSTVRVPNSMLGSLYVQTVGGRERRGLPTWNYVQDLDAVRRLFGPETVALVQTHLIRPPGELVTSASQPSLTPLKGGRFDPTAV